MFKKDFPKEVNRNYFCKQEKLNDEEVFVVDDKLVIGLLYKAKKCRGSDISKIESHVKLQENFVLLKMIFH